VNTCTNKIWLHRTCAVELMTSSIRVCCAHAADRPKGRATSSRNVAANTVAAYSVDIIKFWADNGLQAPSKGV